MRDRATVSGDPGDGRGSESQGAWGEVLGETVLWSPPLLSAEVGDHLCPGGTGQVVCLGSQPLCTLSRRLLWGFPRDDLEGSGGGAVGAGRRGCAAPA